MMLGAAEQRWVEVGGSMIAIDTLVHNFLHRTGILRRFSAVHAYGLGCYRSGGCTDLVCRVADLIDARAFNPAYPASFPRFVHNAIWRYCAQRGLNVCNGKRPMRARRRAAEPDLWRRALAISGRWSAADHHFSACPGSAQRSGAREGGTTVDGGDRRLSFQ